MSFNAWLLFVVTVFFVSATPGPNMLLAMTHGIRYGVRHTLPTMSGLLTGLGLIMAGSAAGLGAVLATSELMFSIIKYAGAAYLIWLGFRTWFARIEAPSLAEGEGDPAPTGAPDASWQQRFRTGFLVSMSNPKAFIFFTALFPQFMRADAPQGPQLLVLAATFYTIETTWQFVYASGGARLKHWLTSPLRMRWVNRFAGGSFIVAGVALSSVSKA